jgi:hypothetical protein
MSAIFDSMQDTIYQTDIDGKMLWYLSGNYLDTVPMNY